MNLNSKIFIDGGDPQETRGANQILQEKLGRPLDGQTTNPTLIAKNLINNKQKTINKSLKTTSDGSPERSRRDSSEVKELVELTPDLALAEYRRIVQEISKIIPTGSISIQVFANQETTADEMLIQARVRNKWIPNASIKFPCTKEGLIAAQIACLEFPINITLVFSQSQAAAVYEVTRGAKYPVFISPFVGRLDDIGENGMHVVANILRMFKEHVEDPKLRRRVQVLTASVRNLDHIYYALQLKSDIITIPFKIFKEWADLGFKQPDADFLYKKELKEIPFKEDIRLGKNWQSYDLYHPLTEKGIESFWNDWMGLF